MRTVADEIKARHSPLRAFLDERFGYRLHDAKQLCRVPAGREPWLVVPPGDADAYTIEAATAWLLQFLVHPQPNLTPVLEAADEWARFGVNAHAAVRGVADRLGVTDLERSPRVLTSPHASSTADPMLLARCCWVLACVTEGLKGGPSAPRRRAIAQFRHSDASVDEALEATPQDALYQLTAFRHIFATRLLPQLERTAGTWVLGPRLAGASVLQPKPGLLIDGRFVEVDMSARWQPLNEQALWRGLATALLDFDGGCGVHAFGSLNPRFGEYGSWTVAWVLSDLADDGMDLETLREEFRAMVAKAY